MPKTGEFKFPHPPNKPHLKGLTQKQQKFVQEIVRSDNATEAAAKSYNTIVPKAIATENLSKPALRQAILVEMENAGVTNGRLTSKLSEGLDATRGEKPDYYARHRYLDTALKLKDAYPDKKVKIEKRSANIDILLGRPYGSLQQEVARLSGEVRELSEVS